MSRIRQIAGILLTVLSVGYFAHVVVRTLRTADLSGLTSSPGIGAVLLTAMASVISVIVTGWAWGNLLDRHTLATRELVAIIGRTQIAKYLPGNVGHHLTRSALAVERGIPLRVVARTLAVEALLLAATATGAALLAAPILRPPWRRAVLAYLMNFLLLGAGLYLVAWAVADLGMDALPRVIATFALAWVGGFVVPAAPAGLGVREGILVALLPIEAEHALPAVLGFRMATTIGDLLSLCMGLALNIGQSQAVVGDGRGNE